MLATPANWCSEQNVPRFITMYKPWWFLFLLFCLFLLIFILWGGIQSAKVNRWRLRNNLWELIFSLHHVGSGESNSHATKLGGKRLYLMSLLPGSAFQFLGDRFKKFGMSLDSPCSWGWPWTPVLLLPHPKSWDYKCVPPHPGLSGFETISISRSHLLLNWITRNNWKLDKIIIFPACWFECCKWKKSLDCRSFL